MTDLTNTEIKQAIKTEVKNLGFILSGFTTPEPTEHFNDYEEWVNAGYHADMNYLARPSAMEKRKDPRLIFSETKTILVLGIPYPVPNNQDQTGYPIAAYAQGQDYHNLIAEKLALFQPWLEQLIEKPVQTRVFTDTAPILERELAARAGLGWIGRNSLLIHPTIGSFFFLSEVFMDLELPPDQPFQRDLCGTCTRCINQCPTQCIQSNRQIDSNRCLSYLTIEKKQLFTQQEREWISPSVFGCDQCQVVCPWNQKRLQADPFPRLFEPEKKLASLQTADLLLLEKKEFLSKYRHTPIYRSKRFGLIRNLLAVIAKYGDTKDLQILEVYLQREENESLRKLAFDAQQYIRERYAENED